MTPAPGRPEQRRRALLTFAPWRLETYKPGLMTYVPRRLETWKRSQAELTDLRVEGWLLRHAGGDVTAVVAAANLDPSALDERRRAAIVEAFAGLCRSLDFALQILVQVRRIPADWASASGEGVGPDLAAPPLELAMRTHWHEHLSRTAAFSRSVLLIPTCPDGSGPSLERAVAAVLESTRQVGIPARLLQGEDLTRCVEGAFPPRGPTTAVAAWREEPGHARIGSTLVTGHVMRRLPGAPVRAGWLAPLLAVPAECDVALHLLPAGTAEAVGSLGRRLRGLSAQRLLDIDRGALADAWNDAAIDNATALRDRLARNLSRPLRLSICAVSRGESSAALERSRQTVAAGFAATLSQVRSARFRQLDAAITAAPLGRDRLQEHKLVDSRAAATCLPWTQSSFDDGAGYRLGVLHGSGAPVRVDPFDTERHSNANVAIIAASGHGKSFAIGALVLEALTCGTPSVIIDPEEEYRSLVAALGGDYLSLRPGGGTSINVFELMGPAGSGTGNAGAGTAETTQVVVELVQVLCGGRLGEVERAHVDQAARRAQQRAEGRWRPAVLGDCVEDLERTAPSVAVVLRRVCSGPLGELFSRPSSIRLDATVAAISFRDLSDEFVGAATLLVARWLWCLVRDRRGRRHVIFDEVGMLCLHAPLRALLVQLARRCRKYGASLVVATQNAQDLLQTEEGMVVATNCALVLLGGHRAAETARMERAFGLTDPQRRFLENAARGDFVMIAGNRRAQLRVRVPELHRRLLVEQPPTPGPGISPRF